MLILSSEIIVILTIISLTLQYLEKKKITFEVTLSVLLAVEPIPLIKRVGGTISRIYPDSPNRENSRKRVLKIFSLRSSKTSRPLFSTYAATLMRSRERVKKSPFETTKANLSSKTPRKTALPLRVASIRKKTENSTNIVCFPTNQSF